MLRLMRKGQSTAEYAIVIGLVIAAAVAMQVYVKRSIQGKMKDAADYNDDSATMLTTKQYEPYYLSTSSDSARDESTTAATTTGGGVTRTINTDTASRTGTQDISGVESAD